MPSSQFPGSGLDSPGPFIAEHYVTGLPIHLFLHQHPTPSLPLHLSRLPPKARHLRVSTTCTRRQTTLPPSSSRSHIDRLLLLQSIPSRYLSAFTRERVPFPDSSFRCQNFSTPTRFVTSRRRARCRGRGGPSGRKEKEEDSMMMIVSVSTSDDDMLMYGYAGDT